MKPFAKPASRCREKRPPPDANPFSDSEFGKNLVNLPNQFTATRIADSSSRNALNFSSARTTNRFPSPRCASAIQIVRPLESIAERPAPTPTGFAEIVGDYFPGFHARRNCASFAPPRLPPNGRNTLHSSECPTIRSCIVGGHHCVTTFDDLPTAASVVLNEI